MSGRWRTAPPAHSLRHSPVALVIDVVRLRRGHGLTVSETYEHAGQAVRASADLLRWLGVEPDHNLPKPSVEHSPVVVPAETLTRAAGIDPDAVVSWPRRVS